MAPATAATSPPISKRRVLLVDDHPVLRRGVTELIDGEESLEVCGEAGTMPDAFTEIGKLKPDIVVIDVSLDGNSGIELMKHLAFKYSSLPILAYSGHDEQIYAERALRAGAKGYVMKQSPPEILLDAIRAVLKGKLFLSDVMSARLLGKLVGANGNAATNISPIDALSDRELEVFQLLGKALSTSAIAEKLSLSVKTIETYREHLKQKLNLKTGPELLRYAIEWSLSQS